MEHHLQQLSEIIRAGPPAIWYPQTGPQSLAYVSMADELYFGGAAGGGKSDLMIGLALTAHQNALFLRTEASQLTSTRQRLMELKRVEDDWRGNGPYGGFFETGDGRRLELNGCDSFRDANAKYRGRPHDLKLYDELPLFKKDVYEFINGWNRTTHAGQRCRVIGAGNPPAEPAEEWVLDYWAPWLTRFTAQAGELRWFVKIENEDKEVENGTPFMYKDELLYPRSRTFIPAKLEDNPILEATGYRQTLQNMPEPYRSQLLYGDMTAGRTDAEHQLIPTEWIEKSMARWRERTQAERESVFLTCAGIDPSRGGKDRSVIAKRYENYIDRLVVIRGVEVREGPMLATKVMMNIDHMGAPLIIDITGTAGGGLYDSLELMMKNAQTYPFVASSASEYKDKSGRIQMRNKRTEAYWRLRDALDPYQENPLILPDDKELKVELAAQHWYMYSGKAGIEDKDEIKKRVGMSCDKSDAVAMAMMVGDATGGWTAPPQRVLPPTQEQFMGAVTQLKRPGLLQRNNNNPWT